MKNKIGMSLIFATGLFATQISNANTIAPSYLARQCMDMASQLKKIAEMNRGSICSSDVEVASMFVGAAGDQLYQGKNRLALHSLIKSEHELEEISHFRPYCARFSYEIRPYQLRVNGLINEIERLTQIDSN